MQHKGEIVEKAVRSSGYTITGVAARIGKSRRWMYSAFDNPNLPLHHVIDIGRVINYDFAPEIREMNRHRTQAHDLPYGYNPDEDNPAYWKNKYLYLMEDLHQAQKKIDELNYLLSQARKGKAPAKERGKSSSGSVKK